jgi:hypothetical protein
VRPKPPGFIQFPEGLGTSCSYEESAALSLYSASNCIFPLLQQPLFPGVAVSPFPQGRTLLAPFREWPGHARTGADRDWPTPRTVSRLTRRRARWGRFRVLSGGNWRRLGLGQSLCRAQVSLPPRARLPGGAEAEKRARGQATRFGRSTLEKGEY